MVRRMKLFRIGKSRKWRKIFHPFPGMSSNGITVCHVVILVLIPHVFGIVLYYGWFHCFHTQTFSCRMMNIHQYVNIALSFCTMAVMSSPHINVYVTPFQFKFLSKIPWYSFSICQTVPQLFVCSVNHALSA
jgi:hypothetical protein